MMILYRPHADEVIAQAMQTLQHAPNYGRDYAIVKATVIKCVELVEEYMKYCQHNDKELSTEEARDAVFYHWTE